MGCNCKSNAIDVSNKDNKIDILGFGLKIIAFLIALLLLPIIMVAIIWIMFNTLVLTKETDLKPLLKKLGEKFSDNYDDDDDDDDMEVFMNNDVITMNVEDITNK
jgi:hypothetical protein